VSNFLDGVKEKVGPTFSVSFPEERGEVKEEIARKLGVEEEYQSNIFQAINAHGDDGKAACLAVEKRYDELREEGKIQEDLGSSSDGETLYDRINARIEEGTQSGE
jgi:hypothetical protein